jgi:LysR family transcriptional regulator, hydrogen peroxide-inducible genes activator
MQMHHVRYFLALCDLLNFTRAAKRCNVSQPSLTNGIKDLETQLGGQLFHRNPVRLTELGELLTPYMERIHRDSEDAREAAKTHVKSKLRRAWPERRFSPRPAARHLVEDA